MRVRDRYEFSAGAGRNPDGRNSRPPRAVKKAVQKFALLQRPSPASNAERSEESLFPAVVRG